MEVISERDYRASIAAHGNDKVSIGNFVLAFHIKTDPDSGLLDASKCRKAAASPSPTNVLKLPNPRSTTTLYASPHPYPTSSPEMPSKQAPSNTPSTFMVSTTKTRGPSSRPPRLCPHPQHRRRTTAPFRLMATTASATTSGSLATWPAALMPAASGRPPTTNTSSKCSRWPRHLRLLQEPAAWLHHRPRSRRRHTHHCPLHAQHEVLRCIAGGMPLGIGCARKLQYSQR